MKILFYRYGSICEPDMIRTFQSLQIEVAEETAEIHRKSITPAEQVALLSHRLGEEKPLFVFSINFFPAIAEVCNLYRIPYVCWTVDSPVLELFSPAICHPTNRIFLFDKAQYQYFAGFNPDCIFYLPLASAVERFDTVLASSASPAQSARFTCDISFVGSLYSEKNPMNQLSQPLPEHEKGYADGLVASALKVYGCNFLESCITPALCQAIKERSSSFFSLPQTVTDSDSYVVANNYLGIQVTEEERILTLNTLAKHFKVDLFTRSQTAKLKNVQVHDGISSLTEMPLLFKNSKINLNMTSKSIQTGLPQRIFDIMGCGGFVMTNYQAELPEYFEIGTELEAYGSMGELVDKCHYYLEHEDRRMQIALNGYRAVCESHRYLHRVKDMLSTLAP